MGISDENYIPHRTWLVVETDLRINLLKWLTNLKYFNTKAVTELYHVTPCI